MADKTAATKPEQPEGDAASTGEEQAAEKRSVLTKLRDAAASIGSPVAAVKGRIKLPERLPMRGARDRWPIPVAALSVVAIFAALAFQTGSAPGPQFQHALDSVEQRIAAEQFDEALQMLNEPLGTQILSDAATDLDRARFYALSADAVFLAQASKGLDEKTNHERVAEFYLRARDQYDLPLDALRMRRLIDTMLELRQIDRALDEAIKLPDAPVRISYLRSIVEMALADPSAPISERRVLETISMINRDGGATADDKLWVAAWNARLDLRAGEPEKAIDQLLRRIHAADDLTTPDAGHLFALLGRAYVEAGHPRAAEPHLEHAVSILTPTHPAASEAEVASARVLQAIGEDDRARDRFNSVLERFPMTGAAALAELALSEIAASEAEYDLAADHLDRAVAAIDNGNAGDLVTRDGVRAALTRIHDRLTLEGEHDQALRFAELLRESEAGEPSASSLAREARAHRAIAESLLRDSPLASDGLPDLSKLDPAVLERVRRHHYRAARLYKQVAQKSLVFDADGASEALWKAADGFDKAGDLDSAIAAFGEYVQLRTADDPLQVASLFRLARAHEAAGNHNTAIELFERIISDHPTTDEGYRSYVPLARSYLLLNTAEGDRAAERNLRSVVHGQIVDPEAPEFREALIELGRLYLRSENYPDSERFARAIEYLGSAVERYPEVADDPRSLMSLANAHRLAALAIAEDLDNPLRLSERRRLHDTRADHLAGAIDLYKRVEALTRPSLDQRAAPVRDTRLLRDALLHHADSAYELGKHHEKRSPERSEGYFAEAIAAYDAVARRYPDDQVALAAMVQIVNSHVRLGNFQYARTAQRKARARLDELPDSALDGGASLMSRRQWEEWLSSTMHLDTMASADVNIDR